MKKFFQEFKEFAMRGNVMDMAVGVVIGGAFKGIVDSLVNDLLNPLLPGGRLFDGCDQFYHHGVCRFSPHQGDQPPAFAGPAQGRTGSRPAHYKNLSLLQERDCD